MIAEYKYDIDATTGEVLGFSNELYTLKSSQIPTQCITQEKIIEMHWLMNNLL